MQTTPQTKLTETTRALRPRPFQTNPVSVGLSPNHSVGPTGTVSMLYTSAVPAGPIAPARLQTQEEAEAAREQWRQELRQKDEYKEMFAKEDNWREGSKALKAGMTLQEVIAVMGLPTQADKFVQTSKETSEAVPVSTNELSSVTGMAIIYYSPDGKKPQWWGSIGMRARQLPFDQWVLRFDEHGKLIHE